MTRTPGWSSIALVAVGLLSASCDTPPAYDRALILRGAATDVIVPGYRAFVSDATAMHTSTTALCAAPSADALTMAQEAWLDAFTTFQRTQAYGIGPARTMNLASELGFWPVSPSSIERNIAGTDAIDAHYVDALGAASKGFITISYLLYGGSTDATAPPLDADAIVSALIATPRRCEYVVALTDQIVRNAMAVEAAWDPSGGNFSATLETAGDADNTVWPDQSTALVELLTQMLDTMRTLKNTKLGIPIGHRTMVTSPDAIESPWAPACVVAMSANIQGVRDLWADGSPWDALLRSRDAALADTVLGELAASTAGLDGLSQVAESDGNTFSEYAAGTDHTVGESAYSRVDAAETTMATDVSSRLGLAVAFSDMDGD